MKKADLQVYFHDLQKRYDNITPDPDVQRVDYQIMAHNALTVLERIVDEGLDDDQTRLEAYHSGYDQGRFDEFADRMGKEQAEKVKGELEHQNNCPYCHPGSKVNGRECWYHTTLSLGKAIDSCTYTELDFDPVNRFLEASDEDELFIDINYCPMCGRPLSEKTKYSTD